MNVVLFHSGKHPPRHIKHCVNQILYTNPDCSVHILTNLNIKGTDRINVININDFNVPNIDNYFTHDPVHVQLWQTSVKRMFYLEAFLKESNMKDIIHFDNDVLLYVDLNKHIDNFKKFNFLMTPHFETEYVFGFSYMKDYSVLTDINKELYNLVSLPRIELESLVQHECPHEMRLLSYINTTNGGKYIDNLPVVVEGNGSDNFEIFETIFDPSSYGKHVAGSHCHGVHNKNYVPTTDWHGTEIHHYAGAQIAAKKINVIFDGKYPFLLYNDEKYAINNLHIHSKDLKKFALC